MTERHQIETAPKDGTWVLLFGGRTDEGRDGGYELGDDPSRPVVAKWNETGDFDSGWVFAFWDGAWYSAYESPTHWAPLPA